MNEQVVHVFTDGHFYAFDSERGWEIRENEKFECSGEYRCKHCSEVEIIKDPGNEFVQPYDQETWYCPRVVVVKNEGGYASTTVCLDCILEAVANTYPKA